MNNAAAKASQHSAWKAVAPGWKTWASTITRYSAPLTARMTAGLKPGMRVLDIACGVGDPAISIAKRVGPSGSVVGTDLVEDMLAFAREEAAAAGVKNIEFRHVDGEELNEAPGSFDAVTMRFGLMFMPDAVACLSRAHAALKPGGTVAVAVWQGPQRNPWAAIPIGVLKRHVEVPAPPPDAPGLFAFADRARLESVFHAAGFAHATIDDVELQMSDFDRGEDFVRFMIDVAGPIAMLRQKVPAADRPAVDAEIAREAEAAGGGKPHMTGHAWLATATR